MRRRRLCTAKGHQGQRWRLAVDFHVKVWGDSGKTWPAQLQSECKACQNRAARIRKARKEGRDLSMVSNRGAVSREERLRRKRERYAEAMKDPEARARRRAQNREAATARRRRDGVRAVGPWHRYRDDSSSSSVVFVDAGPLLEWLGELESSGRGGWGGLPRGDKKAVDYARVSGRMKVTTVDRILTGLGRPDVFAVLYGDGDGEGGG